jgi:ribonuclease J
MFRADGCLVVDCGLGFADERFPGIDLVSAGPGVPGRQIPRDKIAGLVITHAHEDHIGAVAYVWKRLAVPGLYDAFYGGGPAREDSIDAGR